MEVFSEKSINNKSLANIIITTEYFINILNIFTYQLSVEIRVNVFQIQVRSIVSVIK